MTIRAADHHALLRRIDAALGAVDEALDVSVLDGCMPGPLHDTPESEALWAEMSKKLKAGYRGVGPIRRWAQSFEPPWKYAKIGDTQDELDEGRPAPRCFGPEHVIDLDPHMDRDLRTGLGFIVLQADDGPVLERELADLGETHRREHRAGLVREATVLACVEAGMLGTRVLPDVWPEKPIPDWAYIEDVANEIKRADERAQLR